MRRGRPRHGSEVARVPRLSDGSGCPGTYTIALRMRCRPRPPRRRVAHCLGAARRGGHNAHTADARQLLRQLPAWAGEALAAQRRREVRVGPGAALGGPRRCEPLRRRRVLRAAHCGPRGRLREGHRPAARGGSEARRKRRRGADPVFRCARFWSWYGCACLGGAHGASGQDPRLRLSEFDSFVSSSTSRRSTLGQECSREVEGVRKCVRHQTAGQDLCLAKEFFRRDGAVDFCRLGR
mmetsp:Transcript_27010/g.68089  ORF Transcript_27010/g.68089 Transcript_27010/m.68089 type:complete len:238 (+) Transcript_27010:2848-3561(+)